MIVMFNITQIIIPSAPIPAVEFAKVEKEIAEEPMFEGWWPTWGRREALDKRDLISAGSRNVDIIRWDATEREFAVFAGEARDIRIATFYYPHWSASVNQKPVSIERMADGTMAVPVAQESSFVQLTFREPSAVTFARVFSLIIWIALAGTCFLLAREVVAAGPS
jgi:hypothetical protein